MNATDPAGRKSADECRTSRVDASNRLLGSIYEAARAADGSKAAPPDHTRALEYFRLAQTQLEEAIAACEGERGG